MDGENMMRNKIIDMTRNYRVTEKTIKARPNIYVEIWHVVTDCPFHVTLMQSGRSIAMSEHVTWEQVIETCLLLNCWGISRERFFVKGSTKYKNEDIQKHLGQGDTYQEQINDVEKHEETCPERLGD